ncbi:hypothetical protein RFI_23180 [Reticulomyxa filosa]|uniref:Transmembrane protein n=1 Tax=Reticulomyxa filosa TaxID=46433 RepID=X6ML53_RETFI|nr:hypothetical protein RFI_23180 [Reticulomyxa filosa]|eukprot:ETO14187.1 hypothetical protein RFI_23180 [Reticulomyxa filosa]
MNSTIKERKQTKIEEKLQKAEKSRNCKLQCINYNNCSSIYAIIKIKIKIKFDEVQTSIWLQTETKGKLTCIVNNYFIIDVRLVCKYFFLGGECCDIEISKRKKRKRKKHHNKTNQSQGIQSNQQNDICTKQNQKQNNIFNIKNLKEEMKHKDQKHISIYFLNCGISMYILIRRIDITKHTYQ